MHHMDQIKGETLLCDQQLFLEPTLIVGLYSGLAAEAHLSSFRMRDISQNRINRNETDEWPTLVSVYVHFQLLCLSLST